MAFDIEMIKAVYARLEDRVAEARKLTGKPLTASEKILYSHLWDGKSERPYTEEKIMLILHQIELLVKMQQHKWPYYSLCKRETKGAVPTTVIVIT